MDTCVCCGKYVPEGRQICYLCEHDVIDIQNNLKKANINATNIEVADFIREVKKMIKEEINRGVG